MEYPSTSYACTSSAPGRGSPGSQLQPLRAALRREALPVRRTVPGRRTVPRMSVWRRLFDSLTSAAQPTSATPSDEAAADSCVAYAPEADGEPDPGEVVWAWVAYEDDPSRGKDRPVLL